MEANLEKDVLTSSVKRQDSISGMEHSFLVNKKGSVSRRMKLCVTVHIFLAIITLGLMLLFIIGRSLAQKSLDQSKFVVTSMSLSGDCKRAQMNSDVACVGFSFRMDDIPSSMGSYHPKMLSSRGLLVFENIEIGRLELPEINMVASRSQDQKQGGGPSVIHLDTTVEITNYEHYSRFAHAIMSKPRLSIYLEVVTEISVNLFRDFVVIFSNIILRKELDLVGMNNLPNMRVLDFNMRYAYQDRMTKKKFLEISSKIECYNPSVISIHGIGDLGFDIYGKEAHLGETVLYNVSIVSGINRFPEQVVYVSEQAHESILETHLMTPFIYGNQTVLTMKGKSATWQLMQGVMKVFTAEMNVEIDGAPMMDTTPIVPINMDLSRPDIPLKFDINLNNPFNTIVKIGHLVFDVFIEPKDIGHSSIGGSKPIHMGAIKLPNDSFSMGPFSKKQYPFLLSLDVDTYRKGSIIGSVLNASSRGQGLPDFVIGQVDILFDAPKENTDPFATTLQIHTDQIRPIVSSFHVENVQMSSLDFIFKLNLSQAEFVFDVALKFINPFGVSIFARKLDYQVYLPYRGQFYLAGTSDFKGDYANWTLLADSEAQFITRVKAHRENIDNGVLLNIAGSTITLNNGSIQGYATGSVDVEVDGAIGHVVFTQRDISARLLEMRFEDGVIINGTINISSAKNEVDPNAPIYVNSTMLFQNPLGATLNITRITANVSLLDLRKSSGDNQHPGKGTWAYCMTFERDFSPIWAIEGYSSKSFVTQVTMSVEDFNQREIGLIAISTALIYGYVPAQIHAHIIIQLENGTTLEIPYYHPYLPIYPLFK